MVIVILIMGIVDYSFVFEEDMGNDEFRDRYGRVDVVIIRGFDVDSFCSDNGSFYGVGLVGFFLDYMLFILF